nr:MAG TPA_asm: hypothetical protein [Caudoviricetes sp.]
MALLIRRGASTPRLLVIFKSGDVIMEVIFYGT